MDEPILESICYKFSQLGNGDGTTDDYEELSIEVQSSCSNLLKDSGYLVLRTPTGWSINSSSELIDLLDIIGKGVPNIRK